MIDPVADGGLGLDPTAAHGVRMTVTTREAAAMIASAGDVWLGA
jgi:hypothetical protein